MALAPTHPCGADRTRSRPARRSPTRAAVVATAAAVCLVLSGCVAPAPDRSGLPSSPPGTATATTPPAAAPTPSGPPAVLLPSGGVEVVAQGLQAPWSILRLPTGGVLVSERDTANVVEVQGDGSLRVAATVPGWSPAARAGSSGSPSVPSDGDRPDYVYAYFTAASDNRIVRMPLTGAPGSLGLGAPEDVLTGIPKAGNHDGGRIAFGPDGFLYATAGDAGNRDAAQDPASLSGKILRMTPDGRPAPGNPFDNLTWSFGHRNPQGIAWDAAGDLWAAEFGQNTWDELNRITRGANYGWPVVEGAGRRPADSSTPSRSGRPPRRARAGSRSSATPCSWRPSAASGCGRSLRPRRGGALTATPWFVGELGRLRDVTAGPDGELWFITQQHRRAGLAVGRRRPAVPGAARSGVTRRAPFRGIARHDAAQFGGHRLLPHGGGRVYSHPMADLERVRRWAEALIVLHLDPRVWSFGFDNAKKRAGLCNYTAKHISVSRYLASRYDDDEIHQILLHEVAHAMAGSSRRARPEVGDDRRRPRVRRPSHPRRRGRARTRARGWGSAPRGTSISATVNPQRPLSCGLCRRGFDRANLIVWRHREITPAVRRRAASAAGG